MTNESISVVLAVYNQAHILERTLRLWLPLCSNYNPGAELIICDDGSDDDTRNLVESFLEDNTNAGVRIVYLRKERGDNPELSCNINQARGVAEGNYVYFVMGDSYPNGYVLNEYLPYLDSHTILTGLRQHVSQPFNHSHIFEEYRAGDMRYKLIEHDSRPWEIFTGNNCLFPKWMLDEVGWWNEEFKGYGAEDEELAMVCFYKFGAKFQAVPEAKVLHVSHPARLGSGDPNYYLAQWIKELDTRYSSGNFDRSTTGLEPRPARV